MARVDLDGPLSHILRILPLNDGPVPNGAVDARQATRIGDWRDYPLPGENPALPFRAATLDIERLLIMEQSGRDFLIVDLHPIELLREGWRLVREQYWLMLGVTVVGLIVGSLAPLGLFMGPMVCGIYTGLFARMRGERATFAGLFRGFEFFVPSFIATLIQIVPIMAMAIPVNLILMLLSMKRILFWLGRPYSDLASMLGVWEMTAIVVVTTVIIFLLSVFFGTFFMFGYPLIVDRRMGGWEAVKLSARASRANFGGAARLMATTTVLSIVASLFCYIGGFMVTPITLAAWAIAYRRMFPAVSALDSTQ